MHKIFDLREMGIEQLQALAEELGIKVSAKATKADIIAAIEAK